MKFDEDKNGWGLLHHKETKNDDDDEDNNLIILGMDLKNEEDESEEIEIVEVENNVNLREEETVSKGDSSDHTREKILSNDNNIDEVDESRDEYTTKRAKCE